MYKKYPSIDGEEPNCVSKIEANGSTCVPFNTDNADYQEYLTWLAEGNTPEPADPVGE